jgi:hypothetical protein
MESQRESSRPSIDTQTLEAIRRKRRYRAQAVLALILILSITFVTLQFENIVPSKIRSSSVQSPKFKQSVAKVRQS